MSKRKESRERKMKKLFAMLFAMIFVVTSRPLTANAATKVIVKTDCKLGAGKSVTKTVPAKISSAKSSKTSVATVKKVSSKTFKITGKKAGSATITVKYKKTTMKISVKVGATSVKNSTIPTSMEVGDMGLYKVSAKNATGDKFTWKSSNSEVIQVGSFSGTANTITALKAGTASVKVTSKNSGKQVTVKINVVETNSGAVPTVTKSPTTEPEVTVPVQKETSTPKVTATVKPTATTTVKPAATITVKPTATTAGVILTATPKVTATPIPTVEPTEKVTATPKVTSTVKPTATPKVTATPTVTPIPESNGPFAGGEGTADSPYLVSTLEQLQRVSEYKDCYFKQISDIDVDYGAFEPLSTEKEPFTGEYDGGECSILNYNYADGDAGTISIFGWIGKNGTIKNVTVKDSFLTAKSGGVLVYTNDGNILNCNVKNTSVRLSTMSTGLICANNNGTIRDCTAEGTIVFVGNYDKPGWHSVGGVVGYNTGNVHGCTGICDIKASNNYSGYYSGDIYVGGTVGRSEGMVKSCQSQSTINASVGGTIGYPYAGGVVGLNDGQVIQCTYSKTIDDITVNKGEHKGLITGGGNGVVN